MRNLKKRSLTSVALSALLIGAISCSDDNSGSTSQQSATDNGGSDTPSVKVAATLRYAFSDLKNLALDGRGIDTLRISGSYNSEDLSGIKNFAKIQIVTPLTSANLNLGGLDGSNKMLEFFDARALNANTLTLPSSMVNNVIKQVSGVGGKFFDTAVTNPGTLSSVSTNGGAIAGALTIAYTNDATATSQKLMLDSYIDTTSVTFSGAKLTDLELDVRGSNKIVSLISGTLENLKVVTQDVNSNLNVTPSAPGALTSVNASGTGSVKLDLSNVGALRSTFGVTGNGRVDLIAAAAGLNSASAANFTGIHKLVMKEAASLSDAQAATVQTIDPKILAFGASGSGVDASKVSNVKDFAIESGNFGATFTNVVAGSNFFINNLAGNSGTVSIGSANGMNSTNVELSLSGAVANQTLAGLTFTGGLNSPVLKSLGNPESGYANVITTLTNVAGGELTILGDTDLLITNALAASANVDASDFSGKLMMVASATSPVIQVGSGGSIVGIAPASLSGAAAGSNIAVTFGAGVDTLKLSATPFGVNAANSVVYMTINGFDVSKDVISCGAAPTFVSTALTGWTVSGNTLSGTFVLTVGQVGYTVIGSDTYVFFAGGVNKYYAIKLAAVTGITAVNFSS
ncbi:MAG: hypothetical protein I8H75_05035 [Myxococcaceae bacterium]|nr:hypothetical protein [Myxococcaceae bacterium]